MTRTPIELGWDPLPITPIFVYGQDWIVNLEPPEGAESPVFPDGTTVTARVYADSKLETLALAPLKSWPCTIVEDSVRIHVEAAETNGVAKNTYMRISVVYPGTPVLDPYVWATGKVSRRD